MVLHKLTNATAQGSGEFYSTNNGTLPHHTTAQGSGECQWLHFPARPPTWYGFWCSSLISLSGGDIYDIFYISVRRWYPFSSSKSSLTLTLKTSSHWQSRWHSNFECQELLGKSLRSWEVQVLDSKQEFEVNLFQTCSHLRGHLVHTMGNLWQGYDTAQPGWPHYTKGQINKHALWVPYVLVTH